MTAAARLLTWQFGGSAAIPETPLHVMTAGTDAKFGADQALAGAGGYADVGLAVGADGAVQVAYLDEHFVGHVTGSSLRVAQGTVGAPLSAPAVLSTGGKGTSSGNQVAAAFSADGTATVAWAKPGDKYEEGGALEVFTRAADGAFGAAQTLAQNAEGLSLAGGPADAAALTWMQTQQPKSVSYAVHASTRPQAGGPFGADETISNTAINGLWPSVAMNPAGDAIAAWVTNTDGSGGGNATAAIDSGGLEGDVAVLAPGPGLALGEQGLERGDQLRARLVGDDHVVHVAALGRRIGVGEARLVVVDQLLAPVVGRR